MRPGLDPAWSAALEAQGIRTAVLARLEFASGTIGVWTGPQAIIPAASGDPLLDGLVFDPIQHGAMIQLGDNTFSYSGSQALSVSLAIPASPENHMILSGLDFTEYQTRTAVLWRALMVTPAGADMPAEWMFRRVRAGAMDELQILNSGEAHTFALTIEAHASMTSNASGSTYLDQKKRYDANDTSQDFAVDIANNKEVPGKATAGVNKGGGGGGGGGGEYGNGYQFAVPF